MKTISIGCDPNAQQLKEIIIDHVEDLGWICSDFGSGDPIYAKVAVEVAKAVSGGQFDRGILICGTGIGMSIAANKVQGAYAALCSDVYSAERAKKSNNANIITLGSLVTGVELAKRIVETWLSSEYIPGGRSEPKIQSIINYEDLGNI